MITGDSLRAFAAGLRRSVPSPPPKPTPRFDVEILLVTGHHVFGRGWTGELFRLASQAIVDGKGCITVVADGRAKQLNAKHIVAIKQLQLGEAGTGG